MIERDYTLLVNETATDDLEDVLSFLEESDRMDELDFDNPSELFFD